MSHDPSPSPLAELHRRLGARWGDDPTLPADYGDRDGEHRALREGCGLVERGADLLEMRGEDRRRFLNGLVTCDVKSLEDGRGVYGFVTEVKGHVLADLRVLALADRLRLELPPGRGAAIAEHLGKYVIVDRVEIATLDEVVLLGLVGPTAPDLLAGLAGEVPGEVLAHREVELGGRPAQVVREEALDGVPAFTLWTAAVDAETIATGLLEHGREHGTRAVGGDALERLRIEAGRPRFGRDFGPDCFPQETGLEAAVSYTKGCYLGQEVIARIHYRGGVNRSLRGLRLATADDPSGRAVVHDGREAGKVTSAADSPVYGAIGLAILHKRVEPGSRVEIAGGGEAEVVALPFSS